MKPLKKEYAYRDVIMLTAAKIVACNLKDNISALSKINAKWNEAYANDLIARIENAHNSQLGFDAWKEVREATSNLRKITSEVLDAIRIFKRLTSKFYYGENEKRNEIYTVLGLKHYYMKSVVRTQTGLINLLYSFKTNLSDALRQELIEKGYPDNVLDSICANASALENANNIQEVLKGNISEKIESRMILYNGIYREVIGVCVVATIYFKNSATKKQLFNFRKIAGLTAKKQKQEAENKSNGSQQDQGGPGNSAA